MKKFYVLIFLMGISIATFSQVNATGTTITGAAASAIGQQTKALNWASFASGFKSEAKGQFSTALGLFAIVDSSSMAGIALGKYVKVTGPNSVAIGVGYSNQELVNNIGNSLMIGYYSTKPTFFVSRNETTQPDGLGKIGIGTITPGSLLQVNGATALGYDAATIAPANGLLVSGNTGIGTATVGSKLQINGNAAVGYSASTAAPANGLLVSGNTGIGTANVGSKLQINGNAAIGYSSSTAAPANGLLISGNLGIGTTAATTTEKLTVNGKVKTNALVLPDGEITSAAGLGGWNKSGNNIYNSNSGNVGIGVTDAVEKLEVLGKVKASEGFMVHAADNNVKAFYVKDVSNNKDAFAIWGNGVVNAKNVYAEAFQAKSPYWGNGLIPDYVFGEHYKLMELKVLEQFVKQNRHLPEVPSEAEFCAEGMDMAKMNFLLLKKIEELTLYVINQQKQYQELKQQMEQLQSSMAK